MQAKTKKKILRDLDRLIDTLDGLHGTFKERSEFANIAYHLVMARTRVDDTEVTKCEK